MPKIKIIGNIRVPRRSQVLIDGKTLEGVIGVKFIADAKEAKLVIELIGDIEMIFNTDDVE